MEIENEKCLKISRVGEIENTTEKKIREFLDEPPSAKGELSQVSNMLYEETEPIFQ